MNRFAPPPLVALGLLAGIFVALLCLAIGGKNRTPAADSSRPSAEAARGTGLPGDGVSFSEEREASSRRVVLAWLREYRHAGGDAARAELLERGLTLAGRRAAWMAELIETNPEAALAESLSFSEYDALPPDVRVLVERPFSERVDLDVFPFCHDGSPEEATAARAAMLAGRHFWLEATLADGTVVKTFAEGWRNETSLSRTAMPAQGIALDGRAALRERVLMRVVSAEDREDALRRFPVGNPDPSRDLARGSSLGPEPVVAVSGGRVFLFRDEASLAGLEDELARLEREKIGPGTGSRVLFQAIDAAAAALKSGAVEVYEGLDLEGATGGALAPAAVNSWTERRKTGLVIRIDFSDKTGDPIGAATIQNRMDGEVNDQLEEMSYGKTGIDTTVAPDVFRMPQPASYYNGQGDGSGTKRNGDLFNHAIAAAKAAGIDTDAFDHKLVFFKSIGMGYCGLGTVGGGKVWLPCHGSKVIVHELGHNYGVSHASHWKVTGATAFDGESVEYGDNTDIMGGGDVPKGHFHVQAKRKLSWLEGDQQFTVDGSANSGTYRIYRHDSGDTAAANRKKAIRVKRGNDEYLWVGVRKLYTGSSFRNYVHGVQINWERSGQSKSHLLDTTPETAGDKNDAGVFLARTFEDTARNVFITPVNKGGAAPDEWVEVTVNIGPFPDNRPPSVTIEHPLALTGRPVPIAANATDPNADVLAYRWDFGDESVPPNSRSLNRTWNTAGDYPVEVTVTDMKGGTHTAQKTIHVVDAVLDPPVNVTATDGDYPDRVEIGWEPAPGSVPTGFTILRDGLAIADLAGDARAYTDRAVDRGDRFGYRIVARFDGGLSSVASVAVTGATLAAPPGAPVFTAASDGLFAGEVLIHWFAVQGAESYRVYRSDSENFDAPSLILELDAPMVRTSDNGPTPGKRHYYRVTAVNAGGEGPAGPVDSGYAGVLPPAEITTPDAPGNEIAAEDTVFENPADRGAYSGLVRDADRPDDILGFLSSVKLAFSRGVVRFSAAGLFVDRGFRLRGSLDDTGAFVGEVKATRNSPALTISLQLRETADGHPRIRGVISNGDSTGAIDACRWAYHSRNPAPMAGRFTALLPAPAGLADPAADGFASVTVTSGGLAARRRHP
ncbi:MAG: PKD domain-containing protein [Akkermansiaceae bacterium]|nr:PKD domain-containing protein [Akkermansiaceae bacterium]